MLEIKGKINTAICYANVIFQVKMDDTIVVDVASDFVDVLMRSA